MFRALWNSVVNSQLDQCALDCLASTLCETFTIQASHCGRHTKQSLDESTMFNTSSFWIINAEILRNFGGKF